jgi:hypothetical protein
MAACTIAPILGAINFAESHSRPQSHRERDDQGYRDQQHDAPNLVRYLLLFVLGNPLVMGCSLE